jgi:hypothetical protein
MSIHCWVPFFLILCAIAIIIILITGMHIREHYINYEIIPSSTGDLTINTNPKDILIVERQWQTGDVLQVNNVTIYTHKTLPANLMITLLSNGIPGISNITSRPNINIIQNFTSLTHIYVVPHSSTNKNIKVSKYTPPKDLVAFASALQV